MRSMTWIELFASGGAESRKLRLSSIQDWEQYITSWNQLMLSKWTTKQPSKNPDRALIESLESFVIARGNAVATTSPSRAPKPHHQRNKLRHLCFLGNHRLHIDPEHTQEKRLVHSKPQHRQIGFTSG
jgi:hypothetical protein